MPIRTKTTGNFCVTRRRGSLTQAGSGCSNAAVPAFRYAKSRKTTDPLAPALFQDHSGHAHYYWFRARHEMTTPALRGSNEPTSNKLNRSAMQTPPFPDNPLNSTDS